MTKPLLPSTIYSLKEAIGRRDVVAFNVGPTRDVYLVVALEPLDYRTANDGFATFAKVVPRVPQRYRVLSVHAGEVVLDLVIDHEPFNIHDIQPLGDDILLACSRSKYRGPNDFGRNGRVYSRTGQFVRELLLGDGIETIQTTRRGELWASYFDEGIFGNFGWKEPVGAAGLVAWNSLGQKVYEYEPTNSVDVISDCYALNVANDDDVWCCYYTEFPLVHLHKKRIASTWNVPVAGSHAFAVDADHALFAGGYKDQDSFRLLRLDSGGIATQIGQFELRDVDDQIVLPERTIGRGNSLYILSKNIIYEIALSEVRAKYGK